MKASLFVAGLAGSEFSLHRSAQYLRPALLIAGLSFGFSAAAEDAQTLKEVVVTGSATDVEARREATTQKIVLERKDIENLGVMTIGEVLGKLPGVESGPQGGDGTMSQRARGMTRDSVQILVDGERSVGGARMAAAILGRLPSGDLERVEILRGSSAEYGGAAPVTVNLIMKKALSKRSTALKAAVGMRGSEPTAQFTLTNNGGEGGFAWTLPVTLNLHRYPTGSVSERQGTTITPSRDDEQGKFSFREFAMAPRVNWKDGADTLSLAPVLFDGKGKRSSDMTQTAAGVFDGDRNSEEENHRRMLRLRVDGEKLVAGSKLTLRASFNEGKRTADVTRVARDAALTPTTSTEHSDSREHEANVAVRLDRPLDNHLLAVGVEYINLRRSDEQVFTGSYAAVSSAQAKERQGVLWVQDDWKLLPTTTLTWGVRGEHIALDSSGTKQSHGRAMPSVAVRWEPVQQWVMRSSLGTGLKMPRLDEISDTTSPSTGFNTPLEADRRGNPDLRPERSLNFEAVVERYLDGEMGVLGANFYARSTQDFTERRVQYDGGSGRWEDRPQNEGKAKHWGFELDGKVRTDNLGWKGATVKAHLTLPRAHVEDSRLGVTRLARDTPVYVFSAGLDESLPSLHSSYGISLQLSGRSSTDIPGEQIGHTKAKTTLDVFWLYKLNPQFNLRVNGQNLLATDTERETTWLAGADSWQLNSVTKGVRGILVALEGRW